MKVIISESKINLLYDKIIGDLIENMLGELNVSEEDGYYTFESPKTNETPFGKNSWGMLWVEDAEFLSKYLKKMTLIFGMSEDDALDILKDYFIEKYNIPIKQAGHEFWFDDDYNPL